MQDRLDLFNTRGQADLLKVDHQRVLIALPKVGIKLAKYEEECRLERAHQHVYGRLLHIFSLAGYLFADYIAALLRLTMF